MRKKSQKYFLPFIMLYFVGPIRQNIVVVGVGLEGGREPWATLHQITLISLCPVYMIQSQKMKDVFKVDVCILYRGLSFFFVIDKVFRGLI